MHTLENGRKVKIKKSHKFFDRPIVETKMGFHALKRTFSTLEEAEAAVFDHVSARNAVRSRYVHNVRNCIPREKATQLARDWGTLEEGEKIHWFEKGGLAVAVRLDSRGKAIDYLSLDEWSNRHKWNLPPEWQFFHNNLETQYLLLK